MRKLKFSTLRFLETKLVRDNCGLETAVLDGKTGMGN